MDRDKAVDGVARANRAVLDAQSLLNEAVAAARGAGATWAQIGDAANMSRQSAHERWGHIPRAGCPHADCACVDHSIRPECDCGHGPGRGRGQGAERRGGINGRSSAAS